MKFILRFLSASGMKDHMHFVKIVQNGTALHEFSVCSLKYSLDLLNIVGANNPV